MKSSSGKHQEQHLTKVGHYLEKGLLHDKLKDSVGQKANLLIGPLHSLEQCLYGAHLLAQKILEIEAVFEGAAGVIDSDIYRLDNPKNLEREVYKYCFFCCCARAYRELKLLQEHLNYDDQIEKLLEKLKPLKDLRDGFEHGAEDYWEESTKPWGEINWKNRLRKGALPKITGKIVYFVDVELDMRLIEEVYRSLVALFIHDNCS